MTSTKAIAGGIAANIITIILWAISIIPGWKAVPDEPKAAILALVSAAVGAAIVYYAPANQQTASDLQAVTKTAPEKNRESASAFGSNRILAGSME